MLKKLTVQNYALIEALEVDFPDGLIILSGETGAGKSILLGALSLLLGKKADASVVKDSGRNCVVEGEFEYNNDELILRRVVSPNGRSRCFINDEPVAIGELESAASKIIDIHAQHQHLLLSDEAFQMEILDYFSDSKDILKEYKENYLLLNSAENELNRLNETISKLEADREYKQFQFDKLVEANLKEGELEELEREQKILANAENIKSSIIESINLLQPNGVSIVQNIKDIIHNLQKCSNFVPEFDELVARLDSCRIEFKDIEAELEAKIDNIDVSPDRLQIIDDRISLISNLFRKYSVSSEAELISLREQFKKELEGGERNEQQKKALEIDIEKYKNIRGNLADKLSKKRLMGVKGLENVMQNKIRSLQMPYAIFNISITDSGKYGIMGKDKVEFKFSANGDSKLEPLQKVASGGELSRIMLCLKSFMAEYTGMPTMIFDEIDTGVSGSIADKMGEMIGEMGKRMQIFAITHLPQIASKEGTHLLVYKEFDEKNCAKTCLKKITGEERVKEVARMLSGAKLTDAAIENAKELLKI